MVASILSNFAIIELGLPIDYPDQRVQSKRFGVK